MQPGNPEADDTLPSTNPLGATRPLASQGTGSLCARCRVVVLQPGQASSRGGRGQSVEGVKPQASVSENADIVEVEWCRCPPVDPQASPLRQSHAAHRLLLPPRSYRHNYLMDVGLDENERVVVVVVVV